MALNRSVLVHLALIAPALATTAIFDVRLETPLSSFETAAGSEFRALAVSPVEFGGNIVIPRGSTISGRVRKARSVGIGLVHERAMLDLEFYQYQLPDGRLVPFTAQVLQVDNAREEVASDGRIRGILAAGGTAGLARGIWKTPNSAMFRRPVGELTGFPGSFWSDFALGPVGAAGMMAFRWVALRFPEPEIRFPAGTEMKLAVTTLPEDAPSFPAPGVSEYVSPLAPGIAAIPYVVSKPNGKPSEDVINIAFTGTRDDVIRAFLAAGWMPAEPLTRSSFSRTYKAYISMRGYPTAPVSRLLYGDREPDFVFQKSLNTVARRHHVRIWQWNNQDIWIAAGTHDIAVVFDPRKNGLTHKIDRAIDGERSRVMQDLAEAGCVRRSSMVSRDLAPANDVVTDGRLALIELRTCENTRPSLQSVSDRKPGTRMSRFVRRLALETRHYILRDNAYHYGGRGVLALYRKLFTAERPPNAAFSAPEMRRVPVAPVASVPAVTGGSADGQGAPE